MPRVPEALKGICHKHPQISAVSAAFKLWYCVDDAASVTVGFVILKY